MANNNCKANVCFEKDGQMKVNEFCSIEEALNYVKDVVLPNGWTFINIEREIETRFFLYNCEHSRLWQYPVFRTAEEAARFIATHNTPAVGYKETTNW